MEYLYYICESRDKTNEKNKQDHSQSRPKRTTGTATQSGKTVGSPIRDSPALVQD